ncbi:protein FAM186B isoform X2 [Trichosurus vulpecula]|uniref:protein FAM186B isoform X2 n=1 Tax=Trichosurus vulpecula TaxID=9337 RepID=UPI00186AF033|nr:protein FAM186B isoform X2 [Trichosurus vulpecula]
MTESSFGRDCTRRPHLVTPSAVKAIISKIEAAQLKRAQEDISIQLSDILGNVSGVISRFQEDSGSDMKQRKSSQGGQDKGKKRFVLLEKIACFSKAAETKERSLYEILNWMSEWGDNLSHETKPKESEKECDKHDEWIEVMERVLPLSLTAMEGGIESLISLCSNLIEEQKKRTLRPKGNFWKAWREKILHKSSSPLQPLSPEQMLKDKNTTNAKVGEVQAMLQELLDSAIFNKGEIKAIKYMSTMVENLNQALILQLQENHKLETQYKALEGEMSEEITNQKLLFQKELQVLEDMKNALEIQLQASEQKYQQLLEEKPVKQQLQMGGGDRYRRNFTEDVSRPLKSQASKKISLPMTEEVLETEMEQKPEEMKEQSSLEEGEEKEEEEEAAQLFPNTKTKDTDVDMGVDGTPFLKQPLPKISLYPEDSKDVGIHAENAVDSKYKVTALKPVGYKGKDPLVSEEREVVAKRSVWIDEEKDSDSSAEMPLKEKTGLSQEEQAEEERRWQERREQWQAEEKRWQARQQKWEQLEREHMERQQQWKLEEEELYEKSQEYMDHKRLVRQRRELDEQQLEQNKETFMSLSPSASKEQEDAANLVNRVYQGQSAWGRLQTPAIYESQLPPAGAFGSQGAHQGAMKLGLFPCVGTSVRPLPCPFPSKSSTPARLTSLPKEKKYKVDVQGQRMNLLLLNEASETWGLPAHLHRPAKKLIVETLHADITRLGYLIQKYSTYRMFQCVRQDVINHIEASRKTGNIDDAKNFYILLEKIDKCQSRRLQTWTEKQKVLEQDRGDCLEQMIFLFSQLRAEWDLNLSLPILIASPEKQKKPATVAMPKKCTYFTRAGGIQPKQFLMAKHRECPEVLKIARERGNEIEAIWRTDLSTSSYPIKKKTPAGVIWSQIDHQAFSKENPPLRETMDSFMESQLNQWLNSELRKEYG